MRQMRRTDVQRRGNALEGKRLQHMLVDIADNLQGDGAFRFAIHLLQGQRVQHLGQQQVRVGQTVRVGLILRHVAQGLNALADIRCHILRPHDGARGHFLGKCPGKLPDLIGHDKHGKPAEVVGHPVIAVGHEGKRDGQIAHRQVVVLQTNLHPAGPGTDIDQFHNFMHMQGIWQGKHTAGKQELITRFVKCFHPQTSEFSVSGYTKGLCRSVSSQGRALGTQSLRTSVNPVCLL